MDMKKLADEAIALAKSASVVLPALGTGATIAQSILDVITGLRHEGGQDKQTEAELEEAHDQLFNAMMEKGHNLSNRLRGG